MFNKLREKYMGSQANIVTSSGGSIEVNGVKYTGNNVSVRNGKVTIDGVVQADHSKEPRIMIYVTGDCETVQSSDGDIIINGDVSGDVQSTNGDIEAENVTGKVTTTNGDVECWDVGGDVTTTNGDIRHK